MTCLAVKDLCKRFGDRVVLQGVNFEVGEGEVHGIMGPNGAGKTTCFHVLTGRYKPDGGRVLFQGEDVTGLAPHAIARLGIARSFQSMNLFDEFTVLENVLVATPELRGRGFDMLGDAARAGPALDRARRSP
jgi:branched-chain amino acid transport system ATP-binding protein